MNQELRRIDPRGPRFGAAITSVLALISFYMTSSGNFLAGYLTMSLMFVFFSWSVFLGRVTHPFSWLYKNTLASRLAPPAELEDPRPPQFAQKVGFGFAVLGMVSIAFGPSSMLLSVAAAFIFLAAFLNAAFGLCLGCQMYLLLKRFSTAR